MTKMIKKKDCKFENGHIVKGDKLVGIPITVWLQLDKLELMCQQYMYLSGQPAYHAGPSLDGFERKSALRDKLPYIEMPETPTSDARVAEAMAFMREVDACANVAQANGMIDRFAELILWCKGKKFVEGEFLRPIDTPQLGNPLELKAKDISGILHMIASSPIVIQV